MKPIIITKIIKKVLQDFHRDDDVATGEKKENQIPRKKDVLKKIRDARQDMANKWRTRNVPAASKNVKDNERIVSLINKALEQD